MSICCVGCSAASPKKRYPKMTSGFTFVKEADGASILDALEVDPCGHITNWPQDFFGDQFGEIAAMSEAVLKRRQEAS